MIRRGRQLVRLVRNLWFLRGELVAWRRRRRQPAVVEVRCVHCGRLLTKPCKPNRRPHVIRYPENFGNRALAGKYFLVERSKPGKPAKVLGELKR